MLGFGTHGVEHCYYFATCEKVQADMLHNSIALCRSVNCMDFYILLLWVAVGDLPPQCHCAIYESLTLLVYGVTDQIE